MAERYLDGESARSLRERFGPSETTIYRRARRQGWRKRDRPTPPDLTAEPPPAPEDLDEAARKAAGEAWRLLGRGRWAAAREHLRMAEGLARLAARLGPQAPAQNDEPEDDVFVLLRRRLDALEAETGGAGA